ncbi:hypothetical protein BBD39_07975 [Arsenophonus endosymbiont of Bemisia tabaci Asia II 3]|nr:hypothetical protein BBD39_07975 [Arsenophonus endosymbiont of Bemisia tabaci Asia II 3]
MKLFTNRFAIASVLTFGYMSAIASPIRNLHIPGVDKILESTKTAIDTTENAANIAVETGADVAKTGVEAVTNVANSLTELSGAEALKQAKENFSIVVTTFLGSFNGAVKKIEQAIDKAEQSTGTVTGSTSATTDDTSETAEELEKTNVPEGLL